jgi:hypothetical protein
MVPFTPDGNTVLVANEGEPSDDYSNDPEGSVSIIDISGGIAGVTDANVTDLGFGSFSEAAIEADGGRVFGNNDTATVAQDLEPEYITVSPDGTTAFVTLQENNAVAKIDIASKTITEIQGLGYKDFSLPGNEIDASNQDGTDGNFQPWKVLGMYQPDAIDSYEVDGKLYYVTANEGDARDYAGYSEEERVADVQLDLDDNDVTDSDANDTDDLGRVGGVADGNFTLQDNDQLGRLNITTANGDTDGDGRIEQIYAYGARSFSIWDADGNLVADTGNTISKIIFNLFPGEWEDGRSDDKGPEPEAIKLFELDGWMYALVGLERTDGFMLFDVTNPNSPVYMDYIFNGVDEALEGIDVAIIQPNTLSDTDRAWGYVAISSEGSNTTTFYRMSQVPVAPTLALLGLGLLGIRRLRRL